MQSVVVSFLHAYVNPIHEQKAQARIRQQLPDIEVVCSHQVCNEYFEFERTSTAVVQGYLQPLVANFVMIWLSKGVNE